MTVTIYDVIGAPLPEALVKSTITRLFAGVPSTVIGAVGVPAGRAVKEFEAEPVPTPFTAATVNV